MAETILFVDDDNDLRSEFIESFAEFDIIEAASGEDALRILKKPNNIDLVLLDVKLPGLSGTEVLKKIRDISNDLGIIILTGYSTKDVAIESLKGHADEYVEKPFDAARLREVIEQVLEAKRTARPEEVDAIDGKIERVKRFAQRNFNKKVRLEEAASLVCLSPKYLSRIFHERSGKKFSDYKLEIKLEKTKELLRNSGLTIDEISFSLGYQNTESLIRLFKKGAGCTPAQYRRESRKKAKRSLSE
ncbi:MAG: response regulator [Candidatus Omnitrophica bacterium]|nr:response regulator [Candidatus Omnitrophota bacterium]MBU4479768.1 response regulator [Candidatus Omnitrophota bacterium]MCG2703291.1 response regulator [Candidatus Omnitrophota bacterium]